MLTRSQYSWTATFAGDPVSRKSTTGLVAQIGNHTVKSGSALQSLTALSVGDAEFYAVVKEGQVGLSLRSMYQDLGTPMKIEIQSDNSTANSLTDRLGAGQRKKHIDTRFFWIQERVQDGDLSIKKVPTAKNCADASVLQQHCASLKEWYSTSRGSHTPDVRGIVLKSTFAVDNDSVHTNTVAFGPSVLTKCSICPHHQTLARTP